MIKILQYLIPSRLWNFDVFGRVVKKVKTNNFVEETFLLGCFCKKLAVAPSERRDLELNQVCQQKALIYLNNFAEDTKSLGRKGGALRFLSNQSTSLPQCDMGLLKRQCVIM